VKPHYFSREHPDEDDIQLRLAIRQGHVPKGCLLGGALVMAIVRSGNDPCAGCAGPREKCSGRTEKQQNRTGGIDFPSRVQDSERSRSSIAMRKWYI
jgi:hypothetical protein